MATPNKPPKHLSRGSKRLWREINQDFELETWFLLTLQLALEELDALDRANEILREEGLYIVTPSGIKRRHPALDAQKQHRTGFLMAWKALNLDIAPPLDTIGRPPGSEQW